MLICTPNSATNCRVLQMCPIRYFSCLAREEMLLKSHSPVLGDGAGRQTDRQSSAGINTPSCADRGCRSPCYNYQMRNRPLGVCGVIRLGSQGSQTNTRSIQAGSALRQHGQRHSKIIIAVVYGGCCCRLQGQGTFWISWGSNAPGECWAHFCWQFWSPL